MSTQTVRRKAAPTPDVEAGRPARSRRGGPLLRLASLGGQPLVSGVVVVMGAALATALVHLRQLVSPAGAVSLAFYNRDALIYKNLIKGQFRKLQRNQLAGEGKRSLTPQQPLDPRQVRQWIAQAGFDCLHQTGVRVFHDYMPEPFRSEASEEQVIEQELNYSTHPAYLHLGRYLHCWLRPAG